MKTKWEPSGRVKKFCENNVIINYAIIIISDLEVSKALLFSFKFS